MSEIVECVDCGNTFDAAKYGKWFEDGWRCDTDAEALFNEQHNIKLDAWSDYLSGVRAS